MAKRTAPQQRFSSILTPLLAGTVLLSAPLAAQEVGVEELAPLSIEQLMQMEITSVSKKSEKLSDAASAIYVITSKDIQRSGVTSIPEALRMVPGMDVGRIDSSQWAISARGFNLVYSDKLLVLIDGRSVYTPLWGGVFWNEQDYVLEDIDRIEVIRGPGATLWGVNATNGVINIVTKGAAETVGAFGSVTVGTEDTIAATRYGWDIDRTEARVYAKAFHRNSAELTDGGSAHDDWEGARSGFRVDSKLSATDRLTVQGDVHYGESGWDLIEHPTPGITRLHAVNRYYSGGNVLGRWTRVFSPSSEISVQGYYDFIDRNDWVLGQRRHTLDLELNHRFSPYRGHDLLWGTGARYYTDSHENSFSVSVDPRERDIDLYNGFIQDEITIIPDSLRVIVGTKLERSVLSGTAFQPNVRAIYTPGEHYSLWAAVSRALRSPARFNHDGRLTLSSETRDGQAVVATLSGNRDYRPEELVAYEFGARALVTTGVSVDAAFFYNSYDDLESAEPVETRPGAFGGVSFVEVPYRIANKLRGSTFGGEISVELRPEEWWRISSSYSYLDIQLTHLPGGLDEIFSAAEGLSAQHKIHVRSFMDLPYDLELDSMFRYVSRISAFNVGDYAELDLRLGWRPSSRFDLSLSAQNLLHSTHREYESSLVGTASTEMERAFYAKATWHFK